jgi:hypothetical protein
MRRPSASSSELVHDKVNPVVEGLDETQYLVGWPCLLDDTLAILVFSDEVA